MQQQLKEVRSLKDLVDDVSEMFSGREVQKEELGELKTKILSVLCSCDYREVNTSFDEVVKTFGTEPFCTIDLWPGFFNKKHAILAKIYIGIDEYTDYVAYVGTVPAYFLNDLSLTYMSDANKMIC